MKLFRILIPVLLVLSLTIMIGCSNKISSSNESVYESVSETQSEATNSTTTSSDKQSDGSIEPGASTNIDTSASVDTNTYRLKVVGEVENPLSFTFDEIKQMKSVREYGELYCITDLIDEGYWTGVKVSDLLEKAIVKEGASKVTFSSYSGYYQMSLDLEKVMGDGFLISYALNDKEYLSEDGYLLRLVAIGEPGNVWVRSLGEIKVQ